MKHLHHISYLHVPPEHRFVSHCMSP